MFAHINKTKGLKFNQLISPRQDKEYFTLQYNRHLENITGDNAVVQTRMHKLPDEKMVLEIDIALYHGKRYAQMFISENYVYSEKPW